MPDEADPIEQKRIPVARDHSFHRYYADAGLVLDLGRDIEFSFFQYGPSASHEITGESENGDEREGFVLSPSVTELCKIRMAGPVALSTAMMAVEALVEEGRIKRDSFISRINRMFDEHNSADDDEESAE